MLEDAFRTPIIRTSRSNCGKVNCFTSHAPLASKQKDKDTRKRASHQHSKWKLRYGWLIVSAPTPTTMYMQRCQYSTDPRTVPVASHHYYHCRTEGSSSHSPFTICPGRLKTS